MNLTSNLSVLVPFLRGNATPLSHIKLTRRNLDALCLSAIEPGGALLPTSLTVLPIAPLPVDTLGLCDVALATGNENANLEPRYKTLLMAELTMFVLSQLQNSWTPLDAWQGLPMRLQ